MYNIKKCEGRSDLQKQNKTGRNAKKNANKGGTRQLTNKGHQRNTFMCLIHLVKVEGTVYSGTIL